MTFKVSIDANTLSIQREAQGLFFNIYFLCSKAVFETQFQGTKNFCVEGCVVSKSSRPYTKPFKTHLKKGEKGKEHSTVLFITI